MYNIAIIISSWSYDEKDVGSNYIEYKITS